MTVYGILVYASLIVVIASVGLILISGSQDKHLRRHSAPSPSMPQGASAAAKQYNYIVLEEALQFQQEAKARHGDNCVVVVIDEHTGNQYMITLTPVETAPNGGVRPITRV